MIKLSFFLIIMIGLTSCSSFGQKEKKKDHMRSISSVNNCAGDFLEGRITEFLEEKTGFLTSDIELSHPESVTMNFILATTTLLPFTKSDQNATIKEVHIKTKEGLQLNCNVLCGSSELALHNCTLYNSSKGPVKQIR